MTRDWYKFFLLAVSTLTEAAKNVYQSRCTAFILNLLYDAMLAFFSALRFLY